MIAPVFKRLRRWIPPVTFVLFLIGTTTFAYLGGVSEFAALSSKILYHAALAICYLCLWFSLSRAFRHSQPTPTQLFWQLTLAILGTWILGFLIFQIQGDFLDFNFPAAPIVYVKSALLNALLTGTSFILVLRFGHLVRFRRTRKSERNWRLLMFSACISFVAVAPFHHHFEIESYPGVSNIVGIVGIAVVAVSVIFIFLNIIRLAWVFRLSFQQKMAAIGLGSLVTLLTAATLFIIFRPGMAFSSIAGPSDPINYLLFYSLPLTIVTVLFMTFGFVYALTSVLSLIFHLPTTGDYQRSVDEMAAMHALTVLVREVAEPEKLYDWIVSTPVDSGRGKAAWLTIQDLESGSLKTQIISAYNIDAHLADQSCDVALIHSEAARTRELISIPNAASDRRILESKLSGMLSLLAVPLITRTEVLGTLFVSHDTAYAFENEDIESIGVFASQASVVLENVRLLEAKIERERLASELSIARNVQQRLLPQSMPQLPNLSLAASSTPAHEVGGDYFDLLELGGGKLVFIVADVSGKGTSAAFYMAEMQGIFQAVARIAPEPSDFLYHVNQALGKSLEKNIFVTAIYGIIDLNSGSISIARAGHSPAILVDVSGNAELLRTGGLGIGLCRNELFVESMEVKNFTFSPGDLIVLYTDGVIEGRNTDGVEFGYERLITSVQKARYERAEGVHDAIRKTIDEFMDSNKYYDDLTLLVIKWHGREPVVNIPSASC